MQKLTRCQNSGIVSSFTLADRDKLDQLIAEMLEQKSSINSFSLKLNTLTDLVENIVRPQVGNDAWPPRATLHSFSPPTVQTGQEVTSQAFQDTSVASIDLIVLDTTPGNHLKSEQMTI